VYLAINIYCGEARICFIFKPHTIIDFVILRVCFTFKCVCLTFDTHQAIWGINLLTVF